MTKGEAKVMDNDENVNIDLGRSFLCFWHHDMSELGVLPRIATIIRLVILKAVMEDCSGARGVYDAVMRNFVW